MHLLTFADGSISMKAAGRRLSRQAETSGLFKSVQCWNMEIIKQRDITFYELILPYIKSNPQGLGNWVWKPKVLLLRMLEIPLGEVLVMLDAGCQLNLDSLAEDRWGEYLKLVELHQGLFMQLQNGQFGIDDLSDNAWTKIEVLDLLDQEKKLRHSGQIQSGIILIKNTKENQDFVADWLASCIHNSFSLLNAETTDSRAEYISHRWEQSILSLMVKQKAYAYIPDETYFAPNWYSGISYPIWAMRNRTGGDAYRRSTLDLFFIALSRLERRIRSYF